MRGLIWYKKDLRIQDHPALYHASMLCTDGIAAVYVIDEDLWKRNNMGSIQMDFIFRGLNELKLALKKINIELYILTVNTTDETPLAIYTLAEKIQTEKLFFNKELEFNEKKRERQVSEFFIKKNIGVQTYDEQLILPFDEVKTQSAGYFKIFTPFKKKWIEVFNSKKIKSLPPPKKLTPLHLVNLPTFAPLQFKENKLHIWAAGEEIAIKQLEHFIQNDLINYDKQRDFPSLQKTSQLSPYLATGMISARTCFLSALDKNKNSLTQGHSGILTWLSELIWREFYRFILIAAPRVCLNQPYQLITKKLPWKNDPDLLEAWKKGQTGFPLVDAAMRQLNQTGWMHNRLRMVTAMFLTKNLFIDWRLGEKYFASQLVDYDFASNNGGWQWSASTGTDAVPYFRIFNPTTQSERFDKEGQFIRQYCRELNKLDNHAIHAPFERMPGLAAKLHYPAPIIHYAKSRDHTIAAFKKILSLGLQTAPKA